jgi:hypothetical protein
MAHWRTLLDESALLGLQLDEVLEGLDESPVPPEPTHEGVTLPPLGAEERATIEREQEETKQLRERRLFVIERQVPAERKTRDDRPAISPSERAAKARAAGLLRAARDREWKQARVREAIARHLEATGANSAKER